jgi:hypothetical protein
MDINMQIKAYYQFTTIEDNNPVVVRYLLRNLQHATFLKRSRRRICRSFVKAFLQMMEVLTAHAYDDYSDAVTIKDTSNTDNNIQNNSTDTGGDKLFASEAPAGNTSYGLLVGTGVTAPTVSDYTMETLIAHGTAATQLSYGATAVSAATVSGTSTILAIIRSYTNGSGGAITVKEIGWVTETYNAKYNLMLRDSVDQAIADAATSTLTLTIVTTV